jgi:hypothetical protein
LHATGPRRTSRFGDVIGPTGFDEPRVEGEPPQLRMRNRQLGIDFALTFDPAGPAFAPAR